MSIRSEEFLRAWLADNVVSDITILNSEALADTLALQCLTAAESRGITLRELESGLGNDLAMHIWLILTAPVRRGSPH